MRTLLLHTDDLRIADNPALHLASESVGLACVFCFDERDNAQDQFGNDRVGDMRRWVLDGALKTLDEQYQDYGQKLQIVKGDLVPTIISLVQEGRFDRVIRTRQHAADETSSWLKLRGALPDTQFIEVDGATLFECTQADFGDEFPGSFSKFKRRMEGLSYRNLQARPVSLPRAVELEPGRVQMASQCDSSRCESSYGEAFDFEASYCEHWATQKLDDYFSTEAPSSYKETRNQFEGENFATGLSTYLALGTASPVQVIAALRDYEGRAGANDSTGWIEFELLWREFFRWYGAFYGSDLFTLKGISGEPGASGFDRSVFTRWCQGETQWPIVNACMKELNATGLLSNRGRQIVASCLINELGLDWRAGAGYFEQQLLDYDACSNWGNWQYIAGVGADPRGGRHFNLAKQGATFDPDGMYQRRWLG